MRSLALTCLHPSSFSCIEPGKLPNHNFSINLTPFPRCHAQGSQGVPRRTGPPVAGTEHRTTQGGRDSQSSRGEGGGVHTRAATPTLPPRRPGLRGRGRLLRAYLPRDRRPLVPPHPSPPPLAHGEPGPPPPRPPHLPAPPAASAAPGERAGLRHGLHRARCSGSHRSRSAQPHPSGPRSRDRGARLGVACYGAGFRRPPPPPGPGQASRWPRCCARAKAPPGVRVSAVCTAFGLVQSEPGSGGGGRALAERGGVSRDRVGGAAGNGLGFP